MRANSVISSLAVAASVNFIRDGTLVASFPLSTQSLLAHTISVRNVQFSSHTINRYYRLPNLNALPPSIDNDVNTDLDTSEDDKDTSNGQMESMRRALFAELEKMRTQFTEMTESLTKAKEREEAAQGNVATLKEQQRRVESKKEKFINDKKSEFVQEMTDISDQLEGAQDNLRQTMLKTRSELTDIQNKAKETEGRLRNEIADLESRLESLRQEAANAAKARDSIVQQTQTEIENIQAESRKEMREVKNNAFADRKAIRVDTYAQETRIQQAEMDLLPAEKEQQMAVAEGPDISVFQNALDAMKSLMGPQVTEMKERRSASEMFFAVSKKSSKRGLEDEIAKSKLEFENAQSAEQGNLQQTISSYELKLAKKEKELLSNLSLSNERAARAVADAIAAAKKNRIALYQEKLDVVRNQESEKQSTLLEAQATQRAVQDQYDAELEDEVRLLDEEKVKVKQLLREQEQAQEDQRMQLLNQIEDLTNKLANQMKKEREIADEDLRLLKSSKAVELDNNRARTKRALNDIMVQRSNLSLLQEQLAELEVTSEEKAVILQGLEDERMSFRKQLKNTAAIAVDRLTLKSYRRKRAQKKQQQDGY